MSRVLVSQLARMGDLTQSLYLLRDLHQAEGCRVSVLVDKRLEGFAQARAPWLETVYTLDLERTLPGFRKGVPWTGLWQDLADELRPLRETRFDRVINLNYGRLPGTVTEAIRGQTLVQGFHVDREGAFGDPWVDLVSRLVQADRRSNRFHLVDVFRFHSSQRVPAEEMGKREHKPLDDSCVLGVQLATRCPKRTWGTECFVEVIRGLERDVGCEILLLGEARERVRAEYVVRRVGGASVRNLVGKTSLEDLVEVLGECDRVLSGDTGTLHLAAYLGVPSVAIFFGPAYLFETGPYGPGHVVLQTAPPCAPCKEDTVCKGDTCRALTPPDTVLRVLKGDPVRAGSPLQVYASGFLDDWMQYRPLHRREAVREDVVGLLHWGSAGEFLEASPGRLPSLATALQFLLSHYELNRTILGEVYDALESSVPKTLHARDRNLLLGILREGWKQLKEMDDGCVGKEPVRPATAAA